MQFTHYKMLKANIYQISYILLILHNENTFLLTDVHNLFRKAMLLDSS